MKFNPDKLKFANTTETKKIFEDLPELKELNINYDFNKDVQIKSMDKFIDYNDFEQWMFRLLNKLNDIRFSYIQLSYSYMKGIPDENWRKEHKEKGMFFFEDFTTEEHEVNKFLFDFFSESFYYHYFSSIDLLHKVINKYFSINASEDPNNFNNRVLNGLKEIDIKLHKAIKDFGGSIKVNRKRRNDFTHNYPVNEIDLRSKETTKDSRRSVIMMSPSYTTSRELFFEIQTLIKTYIPLLKLVESVFSQ